VGYSGLKERVREVLGHRSVPIDTWLAEDGIEPDDLEAHLAEAADAKMAAKMGQIEPIWRQVEKQILLDRLDHYWKEHLATLDALRQVVFLRAYAQKTPINEYKQEAFGLFERMLSDPRGRDPHPDEQRTAMPNSRSNCLNCLISDQPYRSLHRRESAMQWAVPRRRSHAGCARLWRGSSGGCDGWRRSLCRYGAVAQRDVPVRFGAEVQALPRRAVRGHGQQKMPGPQGPGIIFDGNRQPLCIFSMIRAASLCAFLRIMLPEPWHSRFSHFGLGNGGALVIPDSRRA
jgi:hypothetical protein